MSDELITRIIPVTFLGTVHILLPQYTGDFRVILMSANLHKGIGAKINIRTRIVGGQ